MRKQPQKAVAQWAINPIWFALMADCHPRWSVSDGRLESVLDKVFFKGRKTSEGKSSSPEMIKVPRGDAVKMVCNDKLMWLGLQKGDSFLITVTHVEEYNSWDEMLSASTLENLLPMHVLSRGRQKRFNLDDALEVYHRLFYWPLTDGRNGAMRFDVRTHTIYNK
jgi:ASC-1-like (ASCH) protein